MYYFNLRLTNFVHIPVYFNTNDPDPISGLIDGHTHPVWVGNRVHEFALKVGNQNKYISLHNKNTSRYTCKNSALHVCYVIQLAGASYMDVHKAGGGINYTVKCVHDGVDNATNAARSGEPCIGCGKVGCAGDCGAIRSRIARHSSDCTHKLFSTSQAPAVTSPRLVVQLPTSSRHQRKQAGRTGSGKSSSSSLSSNQDAQKKDKKTKKSRGVTYASVPQSNTDNNNVKVVANGSNGHVTSHDASNGGVNVRRTQSLTPHGNQLAPAVDVSRSHSNPKTAQTPSAKIPNGRKVLPTLRDYQNLPTFDDVVTSSNGGHHMTNRSVARDAN